MSERGRGLVEEIVRAVGEFHEGGVGESSVHFAGEGDIFGIAGSTGEADGILEGGKSWTEIGRVGRARGQENAGQLPGIELQPGGGEPLKEPFAPGCEDGLFPPVAEKLAQSFGGINRFEAGSECFIAAEAFGFFRRRDEARCPGDGEQRRAEGRGGQREGQDDAEAQRISGQNGWNHMHFRQPLAHGCPEICNRRIGQGRTPTMPGQIRENQPPAGSEA